MYSNNKVHSKIGLKSEYPRCCEEKCYSTERVHDQGDRRIGPKVAFTIEHGGSKTEVFQLYTSHRCSSHCGGTTSACKSTMRAHLMGVGIALLISCSVVQQPTCCLLHVCTVCTDAIVESSRRLCTDGTFGSSRSYFDGINISFVRLWVQGHADAARTLLLLCSVVHNSLSFSLVPRKNGRVCPDRVLDIIGPNCIIKLHPCPHKKRLGNWALGALTEFLLNSLHICRGKTLNR